MSKGILSSDFIGHILGAAVFGIAFSQLCVQLAVFISCQISVLVPLTALWRRMNWVSLENQNAERLGLKFRTGASTPSCNGLGWNSFRAIM